MSDALIGVSTATVDDLVRLGVAAARKFRVIPIGLDLEPFLERDAGATARRSAREAGVQDGEVLLTFVGRLVPIKRVDVLLRAFAHARGVGRARAARGGRRRRRLAAARAARRRARCGRARSFPRLPGGCAPVAAAADIAVLSSDNEGTPVSLIEAAAAGTPAVATAVGGVPDVVTPETGLLAPAGDSEALASAIVTIAGDAEARRPAWRGRPPDT